MDNKVQVMHVVVIVKVFNMKAVYLLPSCEPPYIYMIQALNMRIIAFKFSFFIFTINKKENTFDFFVPV